MQESQQEYLDEAILRSAVDEVLARSEFQTKKHDFSFLDDFFDKIAVQIREWSDQFAPSFPDFFKDFNSNFFFFILILLVVSLAGYLFIKRCAKSKFSEQEFPIKPHLQALEESNAKIFKDNLSAYNIALAGGKAHEALWHLHRHWLCTLDGQKQILYCKWKSNQRYLQECSNIQLEQLTALYGHVIYGGKEIELELLLPFSEITLLSNVNAAPICGLCRKH